MRRFALLASFLGLSVLAQAGCEKKATFAAVEGVIKINGQPESGLLIQFLPDHKQDTRGPRSTGESGEEGKFTLTADSGETGAVVGFHKVVVEDTRRKQAMQGQVPSPDDSRVPERFTQLKDTPIVVEVKPSTPIVIELTRP
ncbi:MAG TPA: hypothetical protein PKD86_08410 [Gemmatales bacterium]|nr:hypothetical protein [Gemmatales bacterium]HMP59362.1 hypothetical protein [Gemmatales bacterium]